jgi:hypothetical protein
LQDILIRQLGLIGCDECRGQRTVQCIPDDLGVLVLAKKDTDAGVLVFFFDVAVEGFQIEI